MSCPSALLLLLGFLARGRGDVVGRHQSLPECRAFFHQGEPPSGFVGPSQSHLCQRLDGKAYYATLFDRAGRLPVYSAFVYKHKAQGDVRQKGVDRTWKYEPQLGDPRADGNMRAISTEALRDPAVLRSQAVGGGAGAYPMRLGAEGTTYVRGLLSPSRFGGSRAARSSAYSVTNAVAYPRRFHHASWKPAMQRVARQVEEVCGGQRVYMVAGSVRGQRGRESWAPAKGKGRAAIPVNLWMAYCCENGASGATVGRCGDSRPPALPSLNLAPGTAQEFGVGELEAALTQYLAHGTVQIFKGGCAPL
uniref:endonuclease domain-containing 1 protein-like n=1 Tax=Pristiophorus japonicus TaxID=55135 RepID=UPI00398E58BC